MRTMRECITNNFIFYLILKLTKAIREKQIIKTGK